MKKEIKLTDKNLLEEIPYREGVRRFYRLNNGYGLRVDSASLYWSKFFAYEIAIIKSIKQVAKTKEVIYNITHCKKLNNTGQVTKPFKTTKKANKFILKAFKILEKL